MAAPQADETSPRKPLRPVSHAGRIDGEGEEAKTELSWLSLIAFACLVHNTATVLSTRSVWALPSAVGAANVDFVCLFWCLYRLERRSKVKPKTVVWVIAMALTTLLPYMVAAEAAAGVPAMGPGFKMKQLGRKFLLPKV